MLLGAGLWWIRPGRERAAGLRAEVLRDLLAERLAADPAKLTINLGLRYEIQPGPTERFNRMSAWDLEATERVRHAGRDRVPWCRRLQPQPVGHDLRQLGPAGRRGLSAERPHGAPRRLRHHLPAEQHRLLLRARPTTAPRTSRPASRRPAYGTQPGRRAGEPVLRSGADRAGDRRRSRRRRRSTASARRGSRATSRTGACMQVERLRRARAQRRFMVSIGYSASVSRNLLNRSFPIQSLQSIDPATLAAWRERPTSRATAR